MSRYIVIQCLSMEKHCSICNTVFAKPVSCSIKEWEIKRKFCSHKCYAKSLSNNNEWRKKISEAHKGMSGYWLGKKRPEFSNEWKKNMARQPWNKGKKLPQMSGENHFAWKGDNVGYHALHDWVAKELGRPKKCEICNKTEAKRFEWANISGEYKKDITDWKRLCKGCHNKMDKVGKRSWITRRASK